MAAGTFSNTRMQVSEGKRKLFFEVRLFYLIHNIEKLMKYGAIQ
ncbi:hypothetical protein [Microbulbifer guangxiensis]|nr:hypothetical protein [Microbulbifer guangxiensis]